MSLWVLCTENLKDGAAMNILEQDVRGAASSCNVMQVGTRSRLEGPRGGAGCVRCVCVCWDWLTLALVLALALALLLALLVLDGQVLRPGKVLQPRLGSCATGGGGGWSRGSGVLGSLPCPIGSACPIGLVSQEARA